MTCNHCGQEIKQAHKETLSKHKLTMLKAAARTVMETNVNDFSLHESSNITDYNNFQKLRYHGLAHHVRLQNGYVKRGSWLITHNGWAFLRGELNLPKWVTVRNNRITDRSSELINVRDVYYGSEVVHTIFEYFDESGKPVGPRPIHQPSLQISLI